MSSTAHNQEDDKYKDIVAQLQKSIEVPGNVLMLLHPWNRPIVLSRAWCLFEIFTAIVNKADVQMCFAPSDEKGFFNALRRGVFDAKAVCSKVDAMQTMATVEADKTMIMNRIKKEVGLEKYNEQLRQFLEEQYKLVALKAQDGRVGGGREGGGSGDGGGGSSGGDGIGGGGGTMRGNAQQGGSADFGELLKHMRRMHARLETMEKGQKEMMKTQEEMMTELKQAKMEKRQKSQQLE
jgi:uncharacterized membrane protein YgcG